MEVHVRSYIDGVLTLNYPEFGCYFGQMGLAELEISDTPESKNETCFLLGFTLVDREGQTFH